MIINTTLIAYSYCLIRTIMITLLSMVYMIILFVYFSSLKVEHLEPELQDKIKKMGGPPIDRVYFNKGL